MMIQFGFPASFWAEAIATANYIRNRCVTKRDSLDSGIYSGIGDPFEKWFGRRPNISHLRTFGSKAFILNKSPNKGKFDIRGLESIFVRYPETSKAYRIWSRRNRKIHIARDVKLFNEFNTRESIKYIITEEIKDGRFKVEDNLKTIDQSYDTDIGTSSHNPTTILSGNHQTFEDNIEVEREDEIGEIRRGENETPKRGPGRPKGVTNKKSELPSKQYDLRNSKKQSPVVIESSSDDDINGTIQGMLYLRKKFLF